MSLHFILIIISILFMFSRCPQDQRPCLHGDAHDYNLDSMKSYPSCVFSHVLFYFSMVCSDSLSDFFGWHPGMPFSSSAYSDLWIVKLDSLELTHVSEIDNLYISIRSSTSSHCINNLCAMNTVCPWLENKMISLWPQTAISGWSPTLAKRMSEK